MKINIYTIFMTAWLSVAGIFIQVNRFIVSSIKEPSAPPQPQNLSTPMPLVSASVADSIKIQDPKKYGIIVKPEGQGLEGQMQWELYTENVSRQSNTLDFTNNPKALAMMQKTPQEFQNRLAEIDSRIKTYQKTLEKNPTDVDTQDKLESLYRLKTTLTVLKDKIIVEPEVR